MKGKIVIVCGGRDFSDYNAIAYELSQLNPDLVVSGGAKGADDLALEWAFRAEVNAMRFPAKWSQIGKAAGMARNREMHDVVANEIAENPGKQVYMLVMPGGIGTNAMARYALEQGQINIIDRRAL